MAQRTLACTACHGEQGRAGPDGYYPRLAGKTGGLPVQPAHPTFSRDAGITRPCSIWWTLSAMPICTKLQSTLRRNPYPTPHPNRLMRRLRCWARGKLLAKQGDKALGLPACAQCHGDALTGVMPATPGLLGLPRAYLSAQLGGWKTGTAPCPCTGLHGRRGAQTARGRRQRGCLPGLHRKQFLPTPGPPAYDHPGPKMNLKSTVALHRPRSRRWALPFHGVPTSRASATALRAIQPAVVNLMPVDVPSTRLSVRCIPATSPVTRQPAWVNGMRRTSGRLCTMASPGMVAGSTRHSLTPATPTSAEKIRTRYLPSFNRWPPVYRTPTPHSLTWPLGTQAALGAWRALYFTPASAPTGPGGLSGQGTGALRGMPRPTQCTGWHNISRTGLWRYFCR